MICRMLQILFVIYPWLFNVHMDGVVREANVRVLGKGLKPPSIVAGLRETSCYLQMIQSYNTSG